MNKPVYCILVFMAAAILLGHTALYATEGTHENAEHDFHRNEAGLFIGATNPYDEEAGGETSFTIGFDYERRITSVAGVMGLVDFCLGDGSRSSLIAAAFAWRPVEGLRLGVGPGAEVDEEAEKAGDTEHALHFVIVARALYEFHVGNITLSPTFGVDFLGETKTNFIYGLSIGYGF